jgi:hypothetical protein
LLGERLPVEYLPFHALLSRKHLSQGQMATQLLGVVAEILLQGSNRVLKGGVENLRGAQGGIFLPLGEAGFVEWPRLSPLAG